MPKESQFPVKLNVDPNDPAPFPPYLPLHLFDNEEHDIRTSGEWILMGHTNGHRKPVPGLALLPSKDSDKECKLMLYTFVDVHKLQLLDFKFFYGIIKRV